MAKQTKKSKLDFLNWLLEKGLIKIYHRESSPEQLVKRFKKEVENA